ncbi:MAG: biotin transporter BioY [Defluviitaleaceae bacterium]|nr:biotin transporter BioY [Defluviitaleaceae bacterium]
MFTTRELCFIGIFVAVITVCAWINIPVFAVPFTLQTFAVFLTGVMLGAKKGVTAVLVYILLGAVGVPVFTQFRGGMGVIFGATGGFIWAFPIMAFLAAIGDKLRSVGFLFLFLFVGMIVNLSLGMLWFAVFTQSTLHSAFLAVFLPFILLEILKIIVVIIVGKSIKIALAKARIVV